MITVYSKDNCPNCDMAVKLAAMRKVEISVKKLDVDYTIDDLKGQFANLPRAFPVVVEDGNLIGSLPEFKIRVLKG